MAEEKIIQNSIIKYLKTLEKNGEPVFWEKRQAIGYTYRAGLPDLYVVFDGKHYEIELKEPKGERSSMQIKWEKIFKQKHIPYAVCKSLDQFKEMIEKMRKGEDIK